MYTYMYLKINYALTLLERSKLKRRHTKPTPFTSNFKYMLTYVEKIVCSTIHVPVDSWCTVHQDNVNIRGVNNMSDFVTIHMKG